MPRSTLLILIVVLAGAAAVGVTAAVTRTPESNGVSRVERKVLANWQSSCESDNCGIVSVPIPYTTPASASTVDVTLTLTFDYRTSRGDTTVAGVSLDDGTPPYERLRPTYPLTSARTFTSTTLTWIRRDLPAAGAEYTFRFSAAPRDGNENWRASVAGTRMTVVIESWTAGD